MSRFPRALAALTVLAAAAPAVAFVRTTTVSGHPEEGLWLWWRTRQVPFAVNADTFASIPGCGSAAQAAVDSFPAWTATRTGERQACTDFNFRNVGTTSEKALGKDDLNLVVVRQGPCSSFAGADANCASSATLGECIRAHNCWSHDAISNAGGSLAITTVHFVVSTGEIVDADMELRGWDGEDTSSGFYFTCTPAGSPCESAEMYAATASCVAYDVANTITHEAGHVLGLDHVCISTYAAPHDACGSLSEDTMAPNATVGDTNKRTLEADDSDGVCTIYPAGQATVTSKAASVEGGCAGGEGGGLSLLGLLLLLARRSARSARNIMRFDL